MNYILGSITDYIAENFNITPRFFTIGIVAMNVTRLNLVAIAEDSPHSFIRPDASGNIQQVVSFCPNLKPGK